MDAILLTNLCLIQSNCGFLRSKFTAAVEGPWELNVPSVSFSQLPKMFFGMFSPTPTPTPSVLHRSRSVTRHPQQVLLILSCPVCQLHLRPSLCTRGQWLSGRIAREEGQGGTYHWKGGWCGSEQWSNWEWQGSGFIFPFTIQVLHLLETYSWVLRAFYLNRVLSNQSRARLAWLKGTKPIYYCYMRAERSEREKSHFLPPLLHECACGWSRTCFSSLCAVIYKGLWKVFLVFCFVLFWWRWKVARECSRRICPGTEYS